jgi:hypothetical protein
MIRGRLHTLFKVAVAIGCIAPVLMPHQAYAVAAAETGPIGSAFASASVFGICKAAGNPKELCAGLALLADPPAPGITSISMDIMYNSSLLTFEPSLSGFLCQFSQSGDCPSAGGSAGTLPFNVLPTSRFNPGPPLSGSSETLTDTGSTVSLQYTPGSPVTSLTDTNFFLFVFDFKTPQIIDVPMSTVTYLAAGPGGDFTQTSFVCQTNALPDLGCGSDNGTTGITLNLAVPETSTWALLLIGFAGLAGCAWGRRTPCVS